MGSHFTQWARTMLRDSGLVRFTHPRLSFMGMVNRRHYRKHKPETINIACDGTSISLAGFSNAYDYSLLRSDKDHHLVRFLMQAMNGRGVFWDIGANLGVYSLLLGKRLQNSGSVVAFEPEPRSRSAMESNIIRSGLRNIRVVPAALSSTSGRMTMQPAGSAAAGYHSLVSPGDQPVSDTSGIEVDVLTGDEALVRENLPFPTAMKIDVEGFELEVLHGMPSILKNPDLKAVLIEVHFAVLAKRKMPLAPEQIVKVLVDAGLSDIKWVDRSHVTARRP